MQKAADHGRKQLYAVLNYWLDDRPLSGGEFNRYRKRVVEGGKLDGQFKTLKLTKDQAFASEFAGNRTFTLET